MSKQKALKVGLVGYGFMGRAHSNAFGKVNRFFDLDHRPVLRAVCGRNEANLKTFAEQWGYQSTEPDWHRLIVRADIDLIDIAAPNDTHAEIAIAAAAAGKMVMCEKPLGRSPAESARMVAAVERAGVPNMVWYNYRRVPAVTLAKQILDEGRLGKIFHYRAKFLQDWTISKDLPQGGTGLWRLDASVAGSGVTGDLLAHCIDTAMWLIGPIQSVTGMTETFIKERKHNLTGKVEQVTIDNLGRGDVDHAIEEGAVGEFFHRASTGSGCMKYDAIEAVPELLGDSGDARRHYAKHGQRYRRLASAGCRPRAGHADDANAALRSTVRLMLLRPARSVTEGIIDMSATST